MKHKYLLTGALLVLLALVLAACQPGPGPELETPQPVQEQTPCPTAAPCPTCPTCPEPEGPAVEVPFLEAWQGSPHADETAEAFVHWNEEDPAQVPESCAKCHSTPGFHDFLGVDGSEFGVVNAPAETGTVITCVACHNAATATLSSVVFPSGVEVTGLGPSARCMQCHQGRASTVQVNASLEETGITDDMDTAIPELRFINIHYYAAAATLYGSEVSGGFEYEGQPYERKFEHVEGYDSCVGCHDSHTLELKIDQCAACHDGVASVEDLRNIRMAGSLLDYDGDGNIEEGMFYEIQTLQEMLLTAIQAYATEVAGTPIIYEPATHPYFFIDANANNEVDEGEANSEAAYNAFTGNLVTAAYNYQASLKDPGMYAHNAKYIIQLLYDSIAVLNEQIAEPVDLANAHRNDPGHFASIYEAWRHWDEDGLVPATCSRCHTSEGLPFLLTTGDTAPFEPSNALECTTCHDSLEEFTRYQVEAVTFPSGAELAFEDPDSNLCLNCHQGRESTDSLNASLAALGDPADDVVVEGLRVRNPHYFAAGATLFGAQARGAYQFEGQEYSGRFLHVENADTCIECHNPHALTIQVQLCEACHGVESQEELRTIRLSQGENVDYDGDGDAAEGIALEIETMHEALFSQIQQYALDTTGSGIVYDAANYPYWFIDTNQNNEPDADEINSDNQFSTWTPNLLKAVYNFLWVDKDPGAFAHNSEYILQILYDSLSELGGSAAVQGMTRPEITQPIPTPEATEAP